MKILIFIDLDITIRHFLKTGAFAKIAESHDLVYVFNKDSTSLKKNVHTDLTTLNLSKIRYTSVPRKRMGYWYYLYVATVFRNLRGTDNYLPRRANQIDISGNKFVARATFLSRPLVYPIFKLLLMVLMRADKSVASVVEEEKPDLILHPSTLTGYYINELTQISKKCRLPFVLLMNSWDNPSAKAVCTGLPSKLVVWGEQTKEHARHYMKMPEDRIEIFGAAQFQVYRNSPRQSRQDLCSSFEVPTDKKIILYAGAGSGRHETEYLRRLDTATAAGGPLSDCHILYRPHPWRGGLGDGERNFFDCCFNNVTMDPHMREYYIAEVAQPTGRVCMIDYSISNMLLTLADAVISPLSTMLIEAMTLGKPILIFFPEENHGKEFRTDQVHFADVIAIPEVNVSYKSEEFVRSVTNLYSQIGDKAISQRLRDQSTFFHLLEGATYAERLEMLLTSLKK